MRQDSHCFRSANRESNHRDVGSGMIEVFPFLALWQFTRSLRCRTNPLDYEPHVRHPRRCDPETLERARAAMLTEIGRHQVLGVLRFTDYLQVALSSLERGEGGSPSFYKRTRIIWNLSASLTYRSIKRAR